MTSITSWMRLEPRTRRRDLADGLRAPVHDAAWMLARQWLVGETLGHDGGSPMAVRLTSRRDDYAQVNLGGGDEGTAVATDGTTPLEALLEGRPAHHAGPGAGDAGEASAGDDLRRAADTGRELSRRLHAAGLGDLASALRQRHPLRRPPDTMLSERARRSLMIVVGRVIDGASVRAALAEFSPQADGAPSELPDAWPVPDDQADAAVTVVARWVSWYDEAFGRPDTPATGAWDPDRLEYAFALQTRSGARLAASDHRGGRLDWDAFDLDDAGGAEVELPAETRTAIPAPVSYPGMPTPRWWGFEDGNVDFGEVETREEDLTRMWFLDALLTYGNDWFVAPFELRVGALHHLDGLSVTDSFGRRMRLSPYYQRDGHDDGWRFFELGGQGQQEDAGALLHLPPVVDASLLGPTLERVEILRDEVADVVWGIEHIVQDRVGGVRHPETEPPAAPSSDASTDGGEASAPYRYTLITEVPTHWHPFLAHRDKRGALRFVAAALPTREGSPRPRRPLGAILSPPGHHTRLHAQEVPRRGITITSRYQHARSPDGSPHLWLSRRVSPARGQARSGLFFDLVTSTADKARGVASGQWGTTTGTPH